ncbi:MAG: class I SAM-dependent methyltransferase [Pyrinomonadaceae bacterium]
MSSIEKDFDRLALLDEEGWTQNGEYHGFLLRHVPDDCINALEVGCGTGAFSRKMAQRSQHVTAMDLSSEMIRMARSRSTHLSNIDFEVADVLARDLPATHFDCIATIATLHHLPLRESLLKLMDALRPGGVLMVLDLFETEHNLLKLGGARDALLNAVASGVSVSLRLIYNGRVKPPRAVRAAWEAHGKTDIYPTLGRVRALAAEIAPGARVTRHLLWRYSLIWQKH